VEYLSRMRLMWYAAVVHEVKSDGMIDVVVGGVHKMAEPSQVRVPGNETQKSTVDATTYNPKRKRYDPLSYEEEQSEAEIEKDVEEEEVETKYDSIRGEDMGLKDFDTPSKSSYIALNAKDLAKSQGTTGSRNGKGLSAEDMGMDQPSSDKYSALRNSDMIDAVPSKYNPITEEDMETRRSVDYVNNSEFDLEQSKYSRMKTADFENEIKTPQSLDDLLGPTRAWHPQIDRKEAEKRISRALKSNPSADHVYLFRKSSRVKPDKEDEEVFVLSEGNRKGFVTHYILLYSKVDGVRFKEGSKVPKELESYNKIENWYFHIVRSSCN